MVPVSASCDVGTQGSMSRPGEASSLGEESGTKKELEASCTKGAGIVLRGREHQARGHRACFREQAEIPSCPWVFRLVKSYFPSRLVSRLRLRLQLCSQPRGGSSLVGRYHPGAQPGCQAQPPLAAPTPHSWRPRPPQAASCSSLLSRLQLFLRLRQSGALRMLLEVVLRGAQTKPVNGRNAFKQTAATRTTL